MGCREIEMIGGIATTASARAYARRSRQSAVMFERGAPFFAVHDGRRRIS